MAITKAGPQIGPDGNPITPNNILQSI
jgi:hypothetical protein